MELFCDHILQPEGLLVTNSRSLLFFITISIKRSWLQNKNKFNFLKAFWEPTFKVTYFLKRFLYWLFVLGHLPKGSETSFWCTFSACFYHINIAYIIVYPLNGVNSRSSLFLIMLFNFGNDDHHLFLIIFAMADNGEMRVKCVYKNVNIWRMRTF